MHDLTENLSGDGAAAMRGGTELVVVFLHVISGHLSLCHHQIHVSVGEVRKHGAGLSSHSSRQH